MLPMPPVAARAAEEIFGKDARAKQNGKTRGRKGTKVARFLCKNRKLLNCWTNPMSERAAFRVKKGWRPMHMAKKGPQELRTVY